jgi:hypothetical protein
MDDELRDLFHRRADDVPPHREVPQALARRARRRVALNGLAVGALVVVLAAGAFAGVRLLGGPGTAQPGVSPTATVQPSPTTSGTAAACTSGQLRAVGTLEGAAGSREGAVALTNLSDQTCTVRGTPLITLLDENLDPITDGVTFDPSPPQWEADAQPEPEGWPVVTVAPGDVASVRIRWSNWCPQGSVPPLWRMEVPGGGTVDVLGLDAAEPPPCNGPDQPSTIAVGPFEPAPGEPGPTPAPAAAACTSGQLRAVGTMEGAAGSREGGATLTNLSDQSCTLQGTPVVTLLDDNLDPITDGIIFDTSPPRWQASGQPHPEGWPVVMVAPGEVASVRLRWSNWCPDGRAAPLWRMELTGGGTVDVMGLEAVAPAPCNGPGQPSTISVGPFEPGDSTSPLG